MEAIIIVALIFVIIGQFILFKTIGESHQFIFKALLEQNDLHQNQITSQTKIWNETLSMFADILKKKENEDD